MIKAAIYHHDLIDEYGTNRNKSLITLKLLRSCLPPPASHFTPLLCSSLDILFALLVRFGGRGPTLRVIAMLSVIPSCRVCRLGQNHQWRGELSLSPHRVATPPALQRHPMLHFQGFVSAMRLYPRLGGLVRFL
jgi:hypothetical protein